MRGDTSTENEVAEEAAAAPGERRASIVSLQNMLRKVSQSPFHHQYNSLVPSTSDSSDSSLTKSGSKQDADEIPSDRAAAAADVTKDRRPPSVQNGLSMGDRRLLSSAAQDEVSGVVSRTNPFYDHYLESGQGFENIFVPLPDFQSSPLDLQRDNETVENGAAVEPEPDPFHMFVRERLRDSSQGKSAPDVSADGRYHDITLDSPQTQNASRNVQSKDACHGKAGGISQTPVDVSVNPFESHSKANPSYSAPTKKTDLFQTAPDNDTELFPEQEKDLFGGSSLKGHLDVLSPSSTNTFDPFPSPIARDLFQDFSSVNDPFCESGSTPDPLQNVSNGALDIFQRLPSDDSGGVLQTTSNATRAAPSPRSRSDKKWDPLSSHELLKASESPSAVKRKSDGPVGITLSTPQGTKHNILQPTPFSQARSLSASPGDSPSDTGHVPTFKRPPRPLPRTRPPRPRKPSKAATPTEPDEVAPKTSPKPASRPLPKPVVRLKPKTPESKPVEPQDYVVFEDILLIGQERCVEDWPEDSPQLDPDFKPSGKFRLRRESLKMKAESDGGSGEDQDESGSRRKRKDKKFRVSVLSRRGSKDKSPDDTKENRSRTLPITGKSSKDYFSEMSPRETDDREQSGMDYKKKPLKTKVNQLLRRASSTFPLSEGKQSRPSPHESKEGAVSKKTVDKQDSRRWSEGDALDKSSGEEDGGGQAPHEERGKKKMKIRFVPHRGFAIALEKESKGACGYTPRKDSKDMSDDPYPKKSSFSADDLDDEDLSEMDDCKPRKIKHKGPVPLPPKPKRSQEATGPSEGTVWRHGTPQQTCGAAEDEMTLSGKDLRDMYDSEQDDQDICKSQKKTMKLKDLKSHRAKSKRGSVEDPPGATSSDYLSEAAQAEWLAAQMDERAMACLEDGDGDGDTDSLMEWWNTVEQWDELPSDEENGTLQEDESKSFTILANKVHRGLRVFNKVFTERAEVLWQYVITLHAIADNINDVHHKAKIAGITGGTTTAVGGVTAIAGLVMAPFTLGVSLIVTAVGVGVATAGGITSASATISDNVNNMQDSKKVEAVLQEYEDHLLHIAKILHFVNQGLYKLRGHPFLRSGTQHYSEEWEIRRAVQMISLVDSPVTRAAEIADAAVFSVQGLFRGMDKYFMKESRELKKGCKKELVGQIKAVANVLNDGIVELNAIREELQDATGQF